MVSRLLFRYLAFAILGQGPARPGDHPDLRSLKLVIKSRKCTEPGIVVAKVVKTLSPEQIEALKHGADHYIKMGAKHAAGEYPLIKS